MLQFSQELKALRSTIPFREQGENTKETVIISNSLLKMNVLNRENMNVEDLAALETINEEIIIKELKERLIKGHFHTFVGDVLVILNPNEQKDIYDEKV